MKNTLIGVSLALLVSASAAAAATTTIDFESFADGTDLTGVDLGGVSITAGGATVRISNPVPNGTHGIETVPFSNTSLFRADFLVPVSMVSVDLGDFGGDEDNLLIEAYDFGNTFIASSSATLASGVSDMIALSVSGANIGYVLFGSSLSAQFPNSVYADNLTFSADMAVIPLPATAILMMSAFAAFGALRRRRAG